MIIIQAAVFILLTLLCADLAKENRQLKDEVAKLQRMQRKG